MELYQLKNRAMILLKWINKLDRANKHRFDSTIAQLSQINLPEEYSAHEKFKKILIVVHTVALDAIKHYLMLDKKQRWLICLFFDDSDRFPNENKLNCLMEKSPSDPCFHTEKEFKKKLITLKKRIEKFFSLKASPDLRSNNVCLENISPDHALFQRLNKSNDIDQEDGDSCILDPNITIGTTGLASCLCVIFIGKNKKGEQVVDLSHLSDSSVQHLCNLKKIFIKDCAIDNKRPIETFLLGGCLATLSKNLHLILSNQLNVTDYLLASSIADTDSDDSLSVVISGSEPRTIYYAYNQKSPQEILEQQPQSNNFNSQQKNEPELIQKSSKSKKRAYNPRFNDSSAHSSYSFFQYTPDAKRLKNAILAQNSPVDLKQHEDLPESGSAANSMPPYPFSGMDYNLSLLQWERKREEQGDLIKMDIRNSNI